MEIYIWMFSVSVIFTIVGYYWGKQKKEDYIIQYTIETLIDQGYIRTAMVDDEEVLLKWDSKHFE